MNCHLPVRSHRASAWAIRIRRLGALILPAWAFPVAIEAQQPAARSVTPALVFEGVAVVDVEHGGLYRDQRVVIAGNRISAVGDRRTVAVPSGARIVEARGKYLIPGLWDLHTHPDTEIAAVAYPLFIANGVTGIRNAATVALDTFIRWRREILAGSRIGPPRQILASAQLNDAAEQFQCAFASHSLCVATPEEARQVVDSLKAAGADMLKMYLLPPSLYFAVAAEARRIGIPFGGHLNDLTAPVASDSGASIIDHMSGDASLLDTFCMNDTRGHVASVATCRGVAERFTKNGTWWVPTLLVSIGIPPGRLNPGPMFEAVRNRLYEVIGQLDSGGPAPARDWLHGLVRADTADSLSFLSLVQRVDMPLLLGTDLTHERGFSWGFGVHAQLASFVGSGLTPLHALQTATLNPAKLLHATDSLGTIAPGKLADLVLLDADPLMDITNTTMIRAVVANGRYFDRAALDLLLVEARTNAKAKAP